MIVFGSGDDDTGPGFYLYDLGSTHSSYHNKQKCFPKQYYRLRVGHMIKFGGSTRMILFQGPEEDKEEETEETVTELQEKARKKQEERKRVEEQRKKEEEERKAKEEEKGISWGFAEDATEEGEEGDGDNPDMAKNPFSREGVAGNNENLYLDDPKRTLRGWFEREGLEMPEYKCEEKGYAHFTCTLELPLDASEGGAAVAEATVKAARRRRLWSNAPWKPAESWTAGASSVAPTRRAAPGAKPSSKSGKTTIITAAMMTSSWTGLGTLRGRGGSACERPGRRRRRVRMRG